MSHVEFKRNLAHKIMNRHILCFSFHLDIFYTLKMKIIGNTGQPVS